MQSSSATLLCLYNSPATSMMQASWDLGKSAGIPTSGYRILGWYRLNWDKLLNRMDSGEGSYNVALLSWFPVWRLFSWASILQALFGVVKTLLCSFSKDSIAPKRSGCNVPVVFLTMGCCHLLRSIDVMPESHDIHSYTWICCSATWPCNFPHMARKTQRDVWYYR